ncbi:MAG: hypothetical protein V3U03_17480 [Myxococcota bacterium]
MTGPGPPQVVIRFSDPEEFLDELRRTRPTDGIVRLTCRTTPTQFAPNIRHLEVVGSAVTCNGLVWFSTFVGDLWGEGFHNQDEPVKGSADKLRAEIEAGCASQSIEVRGGCAELPTGSMQALTRPPDAFYRALLQLRTTFTAVRAVLEGILGIDQAKSAVDQLAENLGHVEIAGTELWPRITPVEETLARIESVQRKQIGVSEKIAALLGQLSTATVLVHDEPGEEVTG